MKIRKKGLPPKTLSLLNDYLLLPFEQTKVACPYWVNDLGKGVRGPFSGKGTPRQIVSVSYKRARRLNVNLDSFNKLKLRKFLEDNRIGVDCSGFVFHLLNTFDKENGGDGVTNKYLKKVKTPDWRACWKVNADTLTSKGFTRKIQMKEIKPGDMIRLLKGKHIAFVIEVNDSSVVYAHCSNFTKKTGCHLEKILIKDWKRGLEYQDWQELFESGEIYRDVTYFPDLGDSIVRPKWWR
ncbi:MAG: hypothetical protein ABIC57_03245 [bacterium]